MNAHTLTPKPIRIGPYTLTPLATVPTRAMTDAQVYEIVRAALAASDSIGDLTWARTDVETAVQHVALEVYEAAVVWKGAFEEGGHRSCDMKYGFMFDWRERLQDAARSHADLAAIEEIGSIGEGWELRPCIKPGHFDMTLETAGATPALQVPQGLPNRAYRAMVRAYRKGLSVGRRRVKAAVRQSLNGPALNLENL